MAIAFCPDCDGSVYVGPRPQARQADYLPVCKQGARPLNAAREGFSFLEGDG